MKKLFVLAAMILSFSVMTVSVSAQAKASADKATQVQTQQTQPTANGNVVDKNHDGICDHQQTKGKTGNCTKFVDKNNDGKCDNCVNGTCSKGNCSGKCASKENCGAKGSCNGCSMNHQKGNGNCQMGKSAQPEKK